MSEARISEILNAVYGPSAVKRFTGSAAVAANIAIGYKCIIKEIRIHLSAVGSSGTLTAKLNANAGAVYDTVLISQDMSSITDLVYQPTRPIELDTLDELDIAWANGSTRTYGIEVFYALI